jgi:hypothetical protein
MPNDLIEPATIRSSIDVEALWSRTVGTGGPGNNGDSSGRSLWLGLLDADSRVLPTLVPFDDFPAVPDRSLLRNLRKIVESLVGTSGIASILLLISRPGSAEMTSQDRLWARLLTEQIGSRYSNWPVHLATKGRIQAFAPDDLIKAA